MKDTIVPQIASAKSHISTTKNKWIKDSNAF